MQSSDSSCLIFVFPLGLFWLFIVGNIANAVIKTLADSKFHNVDVWSEVLQDTMLDYLDTGKLHFASTTALALSKDGFKRFYANFNEYKPKIIIRYDFCNNKTKHV